VHFHLTVLNGTVFLTSQCHHGVMRRTKSQKLSDKDLLSQVKKAMGKPRIANSIRKSDPDETRTSPARRNVSKFRKAK
jgi:hypothetical protein